MEAAKKIGKSYAPDDERFSFPGFVLRRLGSGYSRTVFLVEDTRFVVKVSGDKEACQREYEAWTKASPSARRNLARIFAYSHNALVMQYIAAPTCERAGVYKKHPHRNEFGETSDWTCRFATALMKRLGIGDIHSQNHAHINGRIVVFDYEGPPGKVE